MDKIAHLKMGKEVFATLSVPKATSNRRFAFWDSFISIPKSEKLSRGVAAYECAYSRKRRLSQTGCKTSLFMLSFCKTGAAPWLIETPL
jgi:hypothetical protein